MFVGGLNIGQAYNNFLDLVKYFVYYSISLTVIITQIDFLIFFVGMFDGLGGTEFASYL